MTSRTPTATFTRQALTLLFITSCCLCSSPPQFYEENDVDDDVLGEESPTPELNVNSSMADVTLESSTPVNNVDSSMADVIDGGKKDQYRLCGFLEGSTYNNGSCFKVFANLMTWDEAEVYCPQEVQGSILSEPDSPLLSHFLYNLLVSAKIDYNGKGNDNGGVVGGWLGAKRNAPQEPYLWTTTKTEIWDVPVSLASNKWPHTTTDRNCLVINSHGLISGRECDSRRMTICQINVNPICDPNMRYYDGYCYYYEDTLVTYQEAKAISQERTCEMVEIHSARVIYFLQDFLLEHSWQTINFVSDTAIMELSDYKIQKTPGTDFCFLVKGIGSAKMNFYASLDLDYGAQCKSELQFTMLRTSSECQNTLAICDPCSNNCFNEVEFHQSTPGSTFSYYCLAQNMQDGVVRFKYNTQNGVPLHKDLGSSEFISMELIFVRVSTTPMTFQWKFPLLNTGLVHLGVDGSDDKWESGSDIDYTLLGIPPLSISSLDQDRLMFQIYPLDFLPSEGVNDATPFLCRYVWGSHFYFGVVPLDHYDSAWLYLSHVTSTIALLNSQINFQNDWNQTFIKAISPQDDGQISFKDILGDGIKHDVVFLVRSIEPITVELFSTSPSHVYSTLVYPDVTTNTEYVICAPEAKGGIIFIINHWEVNTLSIQIPKLRKVYISDELNMYRAYYIETGKLHSFQLVKYGFVGDVSGTTISGKEKFSVFVGVTQTETGTDASLDQALPASKTGNSYVTYQLSLATGVALFKYKMVALMNDTNIQISSEPDVILPLHGDTEITSMTSSQSRMLTSHKAFYASAIFSDGTMICTTALLPPKYWKTSYVITVTSRHVIGEMAVFLVVGSDAPPAFLFNGVEMPLECMAVTGHATYQSCYGSLSIGHYIIQSTNVGQAFAAYIFGANVGTMCFCRIAGIGNTAEPNNDYRTPPFEEPQDCPDLPPTPTTQPPSIPLPPTIPPLVHPYVNVTLTSEVVEEIREKVREELQVDVRTVSKSVRKKTSAPDGRTSSKSMGYAGIVIMTMVTVLVVIPDVMSLVSWGMEKYFQKG